MRGTLGAAGWVFLQEVHSCVSGTEASQISEKQSVYLKRLPGPLSAGLLLRCGEGSVVTETQGKPDKGRNEDPRAISPLLRR